MSQGGIILASNTISITLETGEIRTVAKGTPLEEIAREYLTDDSLPILAAKVDNRAVPLVFILEKNCTVSFITQQSMEGMEIYRRSLCVVLARAVMEYHHNIRLAIGHSLGHGYYYDLYCDVPVTKSLLAIIEKRMRDIIKKDEPFIYRKVSRPEAKDILAKEAQADKLRLLTSVKHRQVELYTLGSFTDLYHGPLVPSTGCLKYFELVTYPPGFVLRFPSSSHPSRIPEARHQPKLFQVYQESKYWSKVMEVSQVGRMNDIIAAGNIGDLIKIAEALHEKKIAAVADDITRHLDSVKVILIAGPTCSGKTTFSKRLYVHLRVNGVKATSLSLDNYFVNREDCPIDERGEYDFEALEALDLDLFNEHLYALLEGLEVNVPIFDFETGKRKKKTNPMRIEENELLIIEGMHGLNDELTFSIPGQSKYKIYISALTQVCLDDHNRIPTTDTRLLRRIVRDYQYRGYTALDTIKRWPLVRAGEERYIFPFQEEADIMFNSALVYELAVLKVLAEPQLKKMSSNHSQYNEASRLLEFLKLFLPVSFDEVSPTSILREFIGGSSFSY